MQVTIKYTDSESLTVEEIVKQAQNNYGKQVSVEIMPDSMMAYDLIYHGLSMLTTHKQVSLIHDDKASYHEELQKLRHKILASVTDIMDQLVVDNETKVT